MRDEPRSQLLPRLPLLLLLPLLLFLTAARIYTPLVFAPSSLRCRLFLSLNHRQQFFHARSNTPHARAAASEQPESFGQAV